MKISQRVLEEERFISYGLSF